MPHICALTPVTSPSVCSPLQDILSHHKPQNASSLFALTGLSNITNAKNPLSVLKFASSLGYNTLLDAAALAPSSVISLTETPVDAMAISFYKMFGYPTGVGALIVKESFLKILQRPWFAGGTVDVVQVPGLIVTRASNLHEQFEVCFSLPVSTFKFMDIFLGWNHQFHDIAGDHRRSTIPLCISSFPPSPPVVSHALPCRRTLTSAT